MGYQEAPNHIVWWNEQDRIASFHHVEGYYCSWTPDDFT